MTLHPLELRRGAGGDIESVAQVLDALFANSPEAIVIVGVDGLIRYATSGIAMLLGHDAASAVGRSIFEFVHPDDVPASKHLFARRLEFDGADLGHDARVHHSSGAWITMRVTAVLVPDVEPGTIAITIRALDSGTEIEQSLRQRVAVGEYCNKLSAAFLEITEPEEVITRIESALAEVALLTGAEIVDMLLEHRDRRTIERHARWTASEFRVGPDGPVTVTPPTGLAAMTDLLEREVLTDDRDRLATLAVFDARHQAPPVSLLASPLSTGGQRGVLRLMRAQPGPNWTDADAELARTVAQIFGRALRSARSEQLLTLTYREGPLGFSIRTWDGRLVDCNRRYLELYELERDEADRRGLFDVLLPSHRDAAALQLERLRNGQIDTIRMNVEVARSDGPRLWVRIHAVPLKVPGSSEQLVLSSVEDITETHSQRLELEHAARHDVLTGVGNRTAMAEVIERFAARHGEFPSLFVIDLDRFKMVNDSHGHAIGDDVLRIVADRVSSSVRSGDLVARLGGDEFAIVVPEITASEARDLARRLMSSVAEPFRVAGLDIVQTISVGAALGNDVESTAELLVRADRALYAAKERGRNDAVLFDDSMHDEMLRRLEVERDLRAAIVRSELDVHFQPEFSTGDGTVLGVEALLRWEHPVRGRMRAAEFISVAEESGVIGELGSYVLRRACAAFAEVTASIGDDSLVLRVNISAREFARPDLPDTVREALEESGLDASRLCLEMTETTLMETPEMALETFSRLKDIGVQSAIDDFGTGYSSLSYLKRFPVDAVKIDRTFVEDITTDADSRAIVASIMRLAEAMELDAVAEGVETGEQLEVLRQLGCERAQGFVVAGALAPSELAEFLAVRRAPGTTGAVV